ncbi:alpha/beta hydrolase [Saccharothrix variisporea]|uniref:Acetyl esterase n=1 Tax=Saccharothrix variisporea TaxID=543527 RepID=A0A495X761_9PSEU|nr:alpha/beta hydrolase [Saccharothrix variisporea]RKT69747.1 acetyl esterase [Saccharothrix variisporea]
MALNDQARAVLDKMAGAAPLETLTPFEARQAGLGYLDFQGPRQDARVEHLFVPGPTADLPARVYYPATGEGPFPGIVFLHGSGFVILNLDVYDVALRALANATGHAVFAVNYQKAPEHPFPVPLDDCRAATEWFLEHAADLNVAGVGVMGDSAGGTLAAAIAQEFGDRLKFQVLIYPPLDTDSTGQSYVDNATGYGLEREGMRWFWRQYLGDREPTAQAAPLRAETVAGPPAFIATAEYDVVRTDGERYARKLADAGVPVTLREFKGTIHAFVLMDGVLDEYGVLLGELADWLGER